MKPNNPRKAVAMVQAREQARRLAAEFAERQQKLLDSAEHFIGAVVKTERALAVITFRIEKLNVEAEQVRQQGRAELARVVSDMRQLGAREGEISTRLGVERAEIRRLLAEAEPPAQTQISAGAPHTPEPASVDPGPEPLFALAVRSEPVGFDDAQLP